MSPTGFIDSDDEDGGIRPIPPPPVDAPVPNVPDAQQRLFRHPLPQLTITIPDIYVTPPSNTTPSVDYPPYFDDDEDEEGDIDDRVSEDSRLPGGDFERHEYDYDDYDHDGHGWGYDDEYGDENDVHAAAPAVDPWGPQSATAQYYAAAAARPASPYRTTPESDLVDSEPSDPSIASEPSPFADDGVRVEPFPSLPRSVPVPTVMVHADTPASPVSPTSPASFGSSGGGGGAWGTLGVHGLAPIRPPPSTDEAVHAWSATAVSRSRPHPRSEFPPSLGGDRAGAQRTPPSPRREADLLRQLDELQQPVKAAAKPARTATAPAQAPHNVYSPPPVAVRGPPAQQQPLTQQAQQQQQSSADDPTAGSGYVPPPQFVNPNRVVRSPILGRFEPSPGLTGWGQNDVPARR
ncbi:hypothetical protein AMAG_03742 [Allomyces macrogynus ATCC 38327]|uniref:Uncharacterized protein n=1 Tax=Allomyces macrogynus (strain ATCC 38327) TaxID=578462 RepID=A0A0L0SAP3_ALLM3|nr:hypothetical protein AMAG_03742 [Allomyces macrogynus ATCC 38327]|eukprot:KNE59464.1 hypothetical protein AMAG_03742 [Allomyces macrogynus ATCC 38327]